MKYINETIRRRDRLLDEERAIQLLQTAEYGILSMIDEDGMPYAIPASGEPVARQIHHRV